MSAYGYMNPQPQAQHSQHQIQPSAPTDPYTFRHAPTLPPPYAAPPGNYATSIVPLPQPSDDALALVVRNVTNYVNYSMIAFPCAVLARQCQVHIRAKRHHLTPVTLVPVVVRMVAKDGVSTLWKGSLGQVVLFGMSHVVTLVYSDVLGLPKEIVLNGCGVKFLKHVSLKAITAFTMTPFIISAFVETVRSGSGITTEGGWMDIIYRGIDRVRFDLFGGKDTVRRFGVLHLAIPTTAFAVGHYLVQFYVFNAIHHQAKQYVAAKPVERRTRFHTILPDLIASITSSFATDVLLYPIETVINRLYLQGTRTLIDNLDTGISAISVNARYSGFFDCFGSILRTEGVAGLYSGVGALVLRLSLQYCAFTCARFVFEYVTERPSAPVPLVGPSSMLTGAPSAQFAAVESEPFKPDPFAQASAALSHPSPVASALTSPHHRSPFPSFEETASTFGSPQPVAVAAPSVSAPLSVHTLFNEHSRGLNFPNVDDGGLIPSTPPSYQLPYNNGPRPSSRSSNASVDLRSRSSMESLEIL